MYILIYADTASALLLSFKRTFIRQAILAIARYDCEDAITILQVRRVKCSEVKPFLRVDRY